MLYFIDFKANAPLEITVRLDCAYTLFARNYVEKNVTQTWISKQERDCLQSTVHQKGKKLKQQLIYL